jgi:hypothetical protein
MRFNFTHFNKWYPKTISEIFKADNLESAVNKFNLDPNQFTGFIDYPKGVIQIDKNTWISLTVSKMSGYIIAAEDSTYFNVNLYLDAEKSLRNSGSQSLEIIDIVADLFKGTNIY